MNEVIRDRKYLLSDIVVSVDNTGIGYSSAQENGLIYISA